MSLLPSKPDAEPPEDAGPRVIGVDSEDADDVLAALSSDTARQLLNELHDEPAPPADLADRVDTSVQNAQYHLEKLENAGAIEVVETAYSEKGREMDVYAPSDQPLVIFAGGESEGSTLRTALSRLVGAVGLLAVASLAVQSAFGDGAVLPWVDDGPEATGDAGGDGGDGGNGGGDAATEDTEEDDLETADADTSQTPEPEATETPTPEEEGGMDAADADTSQTPEPDAEVAPTPTPEEVDAAVDAAAGLPPGVLFFAGGLFALVVVAVVLYAR